MTGDMGCLTWQREYFPKKPDYGFPFDTTGIDYFSEKIVRSEESQIIKSWSKDLAIQHIILAAQETDRCDEDTKLLWEVYDDLPCFEDNEYGRFKMVDMFMSGPQCIEYEEWYEFGR